MGDPKQYGAQVDRGDAPGGQRVIIWRVGRQYVEPQGLADRRPRAGATMTFYCSGEPRPAHPNKAFIAGTECTRNGPIPARELTTRLRNGVSGALATLLRAGNPAPTNSARRCRN
jgi:hypothetical protein